jgi:outer membrane protein assembly factor BamB
MRKNFSHRNGSSPFHKSKITPRVTAFSATLGFMALCLSANANEWPQFRGPDRDGVSKETGLLKDWPTGGPPLAWQKTGLGKGYSTLSVAGGFIYTIGDRDDASFVVALKEPDGSPAWTAQLGEPGSVGWGNFDGPRVSPTVADKFLFAVGQHGEFGCFDAASGTEKWRKDYRKDFGGQLPEWGYSEAPLVDGDKVVITPGGTEGSIVALAKDTGAVVWRSKEFTDKPHYSSLIAADIGGVHQYIQLTSQNLVGVAAADGKVLWRAARRGQTAVIPTPVYASGFAYVTSGYGAGSDLFSITGSGPKFTATPVYNANKVMVNHHGGVVKVGGFVYGFSDGKGWTCQDFKTGQAKWQNKDALGKGSITCADERLYLRQEDKAGTVVLIEASPNGYKEHGRFDQPTRSKANSWSHPVIANGKLYIRDQDLLLCYNIKAK